MNVREILKVNSLFSGLAGLTLVVGARPLSQIFGTPRALLVAVGVALLIYAADLAITAVRRGLRRSEVLLFATADAAWVIGTLAVLVLAPESLSLAGRLALAAASVPVAWFAALQFRGAAVLRERRRAMLDTSVR